LSLDIVGEAPAALGDEAPGLLLGAALMPMLDGRGNAPKNALVLARWRTPLPRLRSAVRVKVPV